MPGFMERDVLEKMTFYFDPRRILLLLLCSVLKSEQISRFFFYEFQTGITPRMRTMIMPELLLNQIF